MPNPMSDVCPDGFVVPISRSDLKAKGEIPLIVSLIIATSSGVDHGVATLLVKMLGAKHDPALAVFDVLRNASMQRQGVEAVARSVLPKDGLKVFSAIMTAAEAAQKERHRLAHWVWASSPSIPDALLLIDPKAEKRRELDRERYMTGQEIDLTKIMNADLSSVLVYTAPDLDGILVDLRLVEMAAVYFHYYLRPINRMHLSHAPENFYTKEGVLREISSLRPIADVLAKAGTNKKPL